MNTGQEQIAIAESRAQQRARLLLALMAGPVSTSYARDHLNIMSPAARVLELREDGHMIDTELIWQTDHRGRKHKAGVYHLQPRAR